MNAAAASDADTQARVLDDPLELARFSRTATDASGRTFTESALAVSGMTCAACATLIEQALARVDGVIEARVSAAAERATVRWDPARTRASALVAAVRSAGYDAAPDAAAPARELRRLEHRRALWRLFVAALCMMQVMMLATPGYVAEPGDMAPDLQRLLNWGQWVLALPVVAFAAGPFFRGAWHALRSRSIGMDVPVALGVAVTFVASSVAAFSPVATDAGAAGEVYFDSLTMFVAFLLAARYLELRARHRASDGLEQALAAMPQTAWLVDADGTSRQVSAWRLAAGDVVRVPAGEAVPADGTIEQGSTRVDEALLTGESTAVSRGVGDAVVAASTNVGAPIVMRVERAGADTRYQGIVALMREALTQRPAAARLADRWAVPFLWTVLLLAAGSAAAWSLIDPTRAVWVGVSVLIVTCPCALSLAAPAALVSATGALARRGVLLQRLDALERLAAVTDVFVDKTGTLTDGQAAAVVLHAGPGADLREAELGARAAGLARWSSHVLAQAVARRWPPDTMRWRDVQERPGQGVEATDDAGTTWRLGAPGWACASPVVVDDARMVLARDGRLLAAFVVDEALRDGAAAAIAEMQAGGLTVTLLSGDARQRVERMAARLQHGRVSTAAAPRALGSLTPESKLEAVAAAQRDGAVVAMIGDGINDAPVLARADVSFAMGQGARVARQQADFIVGSDHWRNITWAHRLARRTVHVVRQNLLWAAAYNAACIPLAMVGWLPPWAAGLGMAGSSLLVVGNAMRLGR